MATRNRWLSNRGTAPRRTYTTKKMSPVWHGLNTTSNDPGIYLPSKTSVMPRRAWASSRRRSASRPWARGKYRKVGYYKRFGHGNEMKFLDGQVNLIGKYATSPGIDRNLCDIGQGNEAQERVGRVAKIARFTFKGDFNQTVPASGSSRVRVVFFVDTQFNGSGVGTNGSTAWSTIFNTETNEQGVSATIGTAELIDCFKDIEQGSRFRIFYDRTFTKQNTETTDLTWKKHIFVNKVWPYALKVTYDSSATTGAASTIRENCIGCMIINDSNSASFDVDFVGVYRLRFTD